MKNTSDRHGGRGPSRRRATSLLAGAAAVLMVGGVAHAAPAADGGPERTARAATLVKILPLGDSITAGWGGSGDWTGYRKPLLPLIQAPSRDVRFVGSQTSAFAPELRHEGYSGYTIQQLETVVTRGSLVAKAAPDQILLHIGTNDMRLGLAAGAPERLEKLVREVNRQAPKARIHLASIIPIANPRLPVDAYNVGVQAVAKKLAGEGIPLTFVDMATALTTADLGDGVHPNVTGYAKMAKVWAGSLEPLLPARNQAFVLA
ncbi:SGNH/GDSL hydrolase family protein [Kitasatospora sp. NPDC001664]